jgi:hypothetical protein
VKRSEMERWLQSDEKPPEEKSWVKNELARFNYNHV